MRSARARHADAQEAEPVIAAAAWPPRGSSNLPGMQTSATNNPAGKSARQRCNRKQTVNTRSRSETDLRS
jgi:hypothetical protein